MTVFRDADGTARLTGDILMGGTAGQVATVQADGTLAPAAGGAAPVTREQIGGDVVNIADAASALLPWTTSNGPDVLVDRTVPTVPTIITAGVYAVTIRGNASALTAGGTYILRLELDRANDDWTYDAQATGPAVRTIVAATFYLPAGAEVTATAFNFDGAAARDFALTFASLQRLA